MTARILGELKKLGITRVSRSTVVNILRQHGFDPGPRRGRGTWHDFVTRHRETLWACDFLSKKIWTLSGLVDCFVLFFMHIGTRRVHLAGITTNPDRLWMAQRAREVRTYFAAQPQQPRYLIRDLDGKFTAEFDDILGKDAVNVVRVGPCAPNLNAHAERFILTLQDECLDHFLAFGEAHLRYLLTEFLEHYHRERPHQGRDNRTLTGPVELPCDDTPGPAEIACKKRLGGLLRHYHRQAA